MVVNWYMSVKPCSCVPIDLSRNDDGELGNVNLSIAVVVFLSSIFLDEKDDDDFENDERRCIIWAFQKTTINDQSSYTTVKQRSLMSPTKLP